MPAPSTDRPSSSSSDEPREGSAPPRDLAGHEVVVGVGGGIAAYKVCTLVSRLVQRGCGVTVAMTENAVRFVGPLTFQALSARPVFTTLWEIPGYSDQQHIRLTDTADLFVVAPATANLIGKFACGIADDLVSTLMLSRDCPALLAPAMNTRMWNNPIVQRNLTTLREAGLSFVDPEEGWLACRAVGAGRMAEAETILTQVANLLTVTPPRHP